MGLLGAVLANPLALPLFYISLAIPALWPPLAGAHESRPAIATVEFTEEGAVVLGISLNLEAAIAGIGAGHEDTTESPATTEYDRLRSLSPVALRAEFDRFAARFLDRITLETANGPLAFAVMTVEIPEVGNQGLARISQLHLVEPSPTDVDPLYWRADPGLGDSVIRIRDYTTGQIRGAEFVLAGETSGPLSIEGFSAQSRMSVFEKFLELGFTHIVPKGLDHILFVIGLFLLSTRVSALLWQVTAFTVAHTVTLALGMAGIVQLSPAVVEPLIALSIVYVAVENIVTDRLHRWRPVVVFCFGLVHGLGFAGVLQAIEPAPEQFMLSLLSFNLGVELGQLAVIAACFAAVGWFMNRRWYRPLVVIPVSLAIGIVAAAWLVERTGLF